MMAVSTLIIIMCLAGHIVTSEKLNIIFVNDLQYNIFPVTEENALCVSGTGCSGGLSRLVTLLDEEETVPTTPATKVSTPAVSTPAVSTPAVSTPASTESEVKTNSLLLSTGGSLDGEWYNILKCGPMSEAMKLTVFDAVALDAEMFKYGDQFSSACLKTLSDSLLSANAGVAVKSKVKEYGKLKVGIIGFTDEAKLEQFGILNGTNATEAIETELKTMQSEKKTNFHIVIGAATVEKAREIANITDINLVLFSGDLSGESSDNSEFLFEEIDDNTYIASMNISKNGSIPDFRAGFIQIDYDETNDKISVSNITSESYQDLVVKEGDLSVLLQTTMAHLTTPVTTAITNITSDDCIVRECLVGNLIADAIVFAVQDSGFKSPWEEAIKVAIVPGISLNNISFSSGEISLKDIYDIYNPDTFIYNALLTGVQLKQLFDIAISDYDTSTAQNFLQVSGLMSVVFDFKGKEVSLIQMVDGSFVNSTTLQTVNLNDETIKYAIAFPYSLLEMNSYLYLKDVSQELGVTIGSAVEEYIKAVKYMTLFPVGLRITDIVSVSNTTRSCPNNAAEAILITLLLLGLLAGLFVVTWKFVIPRVNRRRDSTLPLASNFVAN